MEEQPVESTLYSLSEAPPPPAERRDSDRHLTIYRVGSILLGDRRELCLIKNISAGGMMVRVYCAVFVGTRVAVELKSGVPIEGEISWVRGSSAGVKFHSPIDVIDVLSASMSGPRPRMPRIALHCPATVRDGANVIRLRVHNISQGGVKVETEAALPIGIDVILTLPGLDPQPAVVRWADEGHAGITFNRLIPFPTLVEWLEQQRSGIRATG